MDIFDRIELVREKSGLSAQKFADSLSVSYGAIANIKYKRIEQPSNALLELIETKYRINPLWLEHDAPDEPMYKSQSDSDIEAITRAMEGENENKKKLIRIMADMPDELLDKMISYLESKLT